MSLPEWVTPEGSLGSYTTNQQISFILQANPVFPSSGMSYSLLNGKLPNGVGLGNFGLLSGVPEPIISDTTYKFTVRAKDNSGNIRDRTFTLLIYGGLKPNFITPSGNILTILDSVFVQKQLEYSKPINENSVDVTLISGRLPPGLEMNNKGLIRGYAQPPLTPNGNPTQQDYKFTVKLVNDLGTITATYEITVINHNVNFPIGSRKPVVQNYYPPTFKITPEDPLYSLYLKDTHIPMVKSGNYFSFKILGKDFDNSDVMYNFFDLPLGLTGDPLSGWITGTPTLNSPGVSEFYFSVRVTKTNFNYYRLYDVPSQTVYELYRNDEPVELPSNVWLYVNDVRYEENNGYRVVRRIEHYDFDGDNDTEDVEILELILDSPLPAGANIAVMQFTPGISSETYTFVLPVVKDLKTTVDWQTPNDLGVINNSTISDLYIKANADVPLLYELVSGNLPPNLKLLPNGDIIGRVVHQPTEQVLRQGDNTSFSFTIKAYSPDFPLINNTRTFGLIVHQYYKEPTESMYFKASPSLKDRKILDSLLKDETIIPTDLLYRPKDRYFGKASEVKFVQMYGINASSIEKYVTAIEQNHYWRNVILGEIKTAVAKDDKGNIMYEVVYSEVLDDQTNDKNQSVDKKVRWPKFIDLNRGPWVASEGEVYASYSEDKTSNVKYHTSLTPGATVVVYPASFINMRAQIAEKLDENFDSRLLPRWMRSQQENGSIPGYVQCWVICYTLPGQSKTVKNNIDTKWSHKLNDIAFQLDRYTVDKSNTYDYNTYLATPAWQNLPSSSTELETLDQKDFYVLFPRKTILPK
jgi:hypothetical protein